MEIYSDLGRVIAALTQTDAMRVFAVNKMLQLMDEMQIKAREEGELVIESGICNDAPSVVSSGKRSNKRQKYAFEKRKRKRNPSNSLSVVRARLTEDQLATALRDAPQTKRKGRPNKEITIQQQSTTTENADTNIGESTGENTVNVNDRVNASITELESVSNNEAMNDEPNGNSKDADDVPDNLIAELANLSNNREMIDNSIDNSLSEDTS